jgi:hypothetical protein
VNLTNELPYDFQPAWAPDGTRIAYASVQGDHTVIRVMNATGTGKVTIASGAGNHSDPDWQPAGNPTTSTLTVSKRGRGSGTVSSSPPGIQCGTDCSETYASGTSVTLTAVPSAGSAFAGWAGACSGTAPCVVTMNASKAVTARFIRA